ncbi:hypothetical protein SAY86_005086 [Trapa natans]|uniref:Uncharacterized protein n=1 Tax=Trapa natans TaxID=22666 RepID=A0AAN7KU53_TRANT|nr:hypothetical protein SAY86_005086 [Trapa natans]
MKKMTVLVLLTLLLLLLSSSFSSVNAKTHFYDFVAWDQADADRMGRRSGVRDPVSHKAWRELHAAVHRGRPGRNPMVARSQLMAQGNCVRRHHHSPERRISLPFPKAQA